MRDNINRWEDRFEEATFRFERKIQKLKDGKMGRIYCLLKRDREIAVCLKNIICECNKRSCPAYTVSASYFIKKWKEL